jgi:hypothetical protein
MRIFLILITFLLPFELLKAEDTIKNKSFGISIGYQRSTLNFIEFGLVRESKMNKFRLIINDKVGLINGHTYYNVNFLYSPINNMTGINLGVSSGGIIAMGLSTDIFHRDSYNLLGIRPEVGVLFSGLRIFYGYRFKIAGHSLENLSNHSIKISWYIPVIGKIDYRILDHTKPKRKNK